jgi:hypothetical protein
MKGGVTLTEFTTLWAEASYDYDADARESMLDAAGAHMASVMPFLLQAGSERELEHRLIYAEGRLQQIEEATSVGVPDLQQMARRHYALLKQALPEGQDPLAWVPSAPAGYGSGPEKPLEHDDGPDFSGYSEVPQGAPGGPPPQVTTPVFEPPQQPQEVTAANTSPVHSCAECGRKLTGRGTCKGCGMLPGECPCSQKVARLQRHADNTAGQMAMSTIPAGIGGGASSPDGSGSAAPAAPTAPLPGDQTSQGPDATFDPAMTATGSRRDPVAEQISAVASSVRASNPHLPPSECRRVARQVVGSYLRTADLTNSVMYDRPDLGNPPPSSGGGGGGTSGGAPEEEAGAAEAGEGAELAGAALLA